MSSFSSQKQVPRTTLCALGRNPSTAWPRASPRHRGRPWAETRAAKLGCALE
jgi:hypothetical protein